MLVEKLTIVVFSHSVVISIFHNVFTFLQKNF